MSRLELRWRRREGEQVNRYATKTERDWLDFVIDGTSLWDSLLDAMHRGNWGESTATDLIGCLGWISNREVEDKQVARLLAEESSELETGRTVVYICPECGDIGCGAITCVVDKEGGDIVWQRFAHEVNYRYTENEPLFDEGGFEDIGPFRFEVSELRAVLLNPPAKEVNP
jgi:hypothetical protein